MRTAWDIFQIPALMAGMTCLGLFGALVSDELGDVLSWMCLGFVTFAAGFLSIRQPGSSHEHSE